MHVKAIGRGLHLSPQKARLVVDMVRGLHVAEALDILSYTPKKGAPLVQPLCCVARWGPELYASATAGPR